MNSSGCDVKASSLGTEDSSSYLSDVLANRMDCINPIDTVTDENSLRLAKLVQGKLLCLCNSVWCSTHRLWLMILLRILKSRDIYRASSLQSTPWLLRPVVGGNWDLTGKLYLASERMLADPTPTVNDCFSSWVLLLLNDTNLTK